MTRAFTLIETLVAITILTVSVVGPMALASQAINDAYHARDEVTASNLAQEAIETVRANRDGNVLAIAKTSNASGINLFDPLSVNHYYLVDPTQAVGSTGAAGSAMFVDCNTSPCTTPLRTNGILYGYAQSAGWTTTSFVRYIHITAISTNEIRIDATVQWQTGGLRPQSFTESEDLFRWVADGSGT